MCIAPAISQLDLNRSSRIELSNLTKRHARLIADHGETAIQHTAIVERIEQLGTLSHRIAVHGDALLHRTDKARIELSKLARAFADKPLHGA